MQPINAALCSFGMSGWVFHAPFLNASPYFNLYGVLERTKNLSQEKYPSAKIFRSLQELLNDDAIELVIVNTPNATHYEYAKAALLAGKHVVVEKPFTVEVEEAEELIAIAKDKNRKLSVYHNRRWDSDYKTVAKVVKQNLVGAVVEAEFHYDRYKEELSTKLHKEIPGAGTGALYDLGAHLIDQALQLFGFPQAVFADIQAMRPISKVDDYFELILYYPATAGNYPLRVRLKATYIAREIVPSFVLHGSKGSFLKGRGDVQEAMLQNNISPVIDNWGVEAETDWGLLHTEQDGKMLRHHLPSEKGNYMEFYTNLFNAIRNNEELQVTAQDGLNVIRIIKAAFESNKQQKVIHLS